MKKQLARLAAGAAMLVLGAAPALGHVTVQPTEGVSESFSRFVVRVPNERDASTTKVVVDFPPLAFLSFQDVAGWDRKVEMTKLDEPIEAFDSEIDEVVGRVTWSGGEIGVGEFTEFPFSAAMPAGENDLEFKALQTYSNGEVVKWTGAEDSDNPAAHLETVELGEFGEDVGELGAVHNIAHEVEELSEKVDEQTAHMDQMMADFESASEEESDDSSDIGMWLGIAGIVLGGAALVVALGRRRT